jgi:hypothetical protein
MTTQGQRDVDGVAVVLVSDVLDPAAGPPEGRPDGRLPSAVLRDHLLATAADTDAGVLLLLDGDDPGPLPQTAVVAAWTRMAAWPGIPLVLVTSTPTGTLPAQVPVVTGVVEATALVRAGGVAPRRELELSLDRFSPRRARVWIREQLETWGIDDPAPAELVSTELVDNAIIHAGSIGTLQLRHRPGLLSVAVSDRSEQRPRLVPPEERAGGGRGLVIVDQLCHGWGSSPRIGGGKVVWANLPLPAG